MIDINGDRAANIYVNGNVAWAHCVAIGMHHVIMFDPRMPEEFDDVISRDRMELLRHPNLLRISCYNMEEVEMIAGIDHVITIQFMV